MAESTRRGVDSEALRAAIAAVVSGLEPDQIILFGSAARGAMTDDSDLDLLVIKEPANDRRPAGPAVDFDDVGRDVDLLVTTRAAAEARREYAGDVHGAALETGTTVYTRTGFDPIETGAAMVRSTLYRPDRALDFLDRAERKWRIANTPQTHPADRCENLQASLEQALKGLIVAQGRQVEHSHKLTALWDDAERDGERIAATCWPMPAAASRPSSKRRGHGWRGERTAGAPTGPYRKGTMTDAVSQDTRTQAERRTLRTEFS